MTIHVVSTGYNVPDMRCVDSVAMQRYQDKQHHWVDAAFQDSPKTAVENLVNMIRPLDPAAIVVWLDLDDRLAHPGVLDKVASFYENPNVWLTYGSYEHDDGSRGISAPYKTDRYRLEPWLASHLKTFRAGLFQAIQRKDLLDSHGEEWLTTCIDQAIMLPMLEMSGPAHVAFYPGILCVYNYLNSYAHRCDPAGAVREAKVAHEIRSRRPYARLTSVPWQTTEAAA